jgi:uncharacterized protein YbaR (Trm112 family)
MLVAYVEEWTVKVEQLLDLIACPKCHGKLRLAPTAAATSPTSSGLLCESCKLLFAYEDGLPNMLISEARSWPLPAAPTST